MKTKEEIVRDWLPRYTGRKLEEFGQYILLVNFSNYVEMFAERFGVPVVGRDKPMLSATAENITILSFGMGSAMAATTMDLLSAVAPKAVLFLGKCGGLKKTKIGDFVLPIAAIRGEGTSNEYMPAEVPALPSFRLQRAVSEAIIKHNRDYFTGTVFTTNRRVWEHDNSVREYLEILAGDVCAAPGRRALREARAACRRPPPKDYLQRINSRRVNLRAYARWSSSTSFISYITPFLHGS
jgi:AMP nucleosidase